jgi:aminobenzoyl-glutamate utilization protein B
MTLKERALSGKDTKGLNRRELIGAGVAGAAGLSAGSDALMAQARAPGPAAATPAAAPPASAAVAAKAVEANRDAILRISREVWANPEVAFTEVKSAAIHVRELRAAGFNVSTGTAGIPTSFIAEWTQGSGGPKIGFMPEYDALPGLGNAAEPRQTPGSTGTAMGHGCGHNMLGAGCTGGAIALKLMMEADRTPGTIRVFGCAAEEGGAVKVFLVRAGLFNDLDAALAWHPAPIAATGAISTAANSAQKIRFFGRTAHAGVEPWSGRSALKAAELFGHGINMMREHILPTARLHYIYLGGGTAVNVVPDFAEVLLTIRDKDRPNVIAMTDWARQVAEGAAMATQTRAEFDILSGVHRLLPNDTLIRAIHRHMGAVPLDWTPEEQAFARAIQREMKLKEAGLATRVLPILGEITTGGVTDVGDVSFVTPTGLFGWPTMPLGVALHTWGVTACGGMSIGDKASIAAAKVLAGVGHDLMTDAGLRQAARADLTRRLAGYAYVSPLPESRKVPAAITDALLKSSGEDEIMSPTRMMGDG